MGSIRGNDTERAHMSELMEQSIQKVKQLPEQDQESIASIILQEIESEHRWESCSPVPTRPTSSRGCG